VALAGAVLLVATTPFQDILRVLESWRAPRLLLRILAVFYRYLFILTDEAEQMQLALSARLVDPAPRRRLLRMAGNLAGTLFLRSLERGETVYQAMCARGFDGRFPSLDTPRWRWPDAAALGLAAAAGLLTVLLAVQP
jgi:cobalt/nickel transport system permease protein